MLRLYLLAALFLCATSGYAAEDGVDKKVRDAKRFFALPVELDFDSGADNGDASILRFAPLYGSPSKTEWKFTHINLVTFADAPGGLPGQPGNPSPEPGGRVFGISDLLHASFRTAPMSGKWILGVGGMMSIPIASDTRLGSGKWSAGPSFRIAYRSSRWNIGAFGGQIWSFAGDSSRRDVSQLIVRGAIRREFKNKWYFVSAPIITSNWKAVGEKWVVPVGGGFGKVFSAGKNPWAVSVQAYYNVIKPVAAPDWYIRLAVIAAIPLGDK